MVTAELDTSGLRRKMGNLIRAARNTPKILRLLGNEVRVDSKERFAQEGPGWPPLAKSTIERLQQTRTSAVTAQGKVRASYARAAEKGLLARAKRGLGTYTSVDELRRLAQGGGLGFTLERQGQLNLRTEEREGQMHQVVEGRQGSRAISRLRKALEQHEGKNTFERREGKRAIETHRLLGKLAGANKMDIQGSSATIHNVAKNKSGQKFSGIHNDGGTAGHGAQIPERKFLELSAGALDRGVDRVEEYLHREVDR